MEAQQHSTAPSRPTPIAYSAVSGYIELAMQTSCAFPWNYRQTGYSQGTPATQLNISYAWDSSTGYLPDIAACRVGEHVDYPGIYGYPFFFPSPPFPVYSNPNPVVATVSGNATLIDHHMTPGTFVTPFPVPTYSFTANQYYFWTCACRDSLEHRLYPASPSYLYIVRQVDASSTTSGVFTVSKDGVTSIGVSVP